METILLTTIIAAGVAMVANVTWSIRGTRSGDKRSIAARNMKSAGINIAITTITMIVATIARSHR